MSAPGSGGGLDRLDALLQAAKRAGADAADAVLIQSNSLSVQWRLGRLEHLERSEAQDLGLRVFVGKCTAIVSATSANPTGFARLAEQAVAMARVVPEDPFAALADAPKPPDGTGLELDDGAQPDEAALLARAAAAEAAALAVHGVTNSEGASAGFGRTEICLATTGGFAGRYARSSHSIYASALAGSGVDMQRDGDYASTTHLADLDEAEAVGRLAGERAIARLNPTRPKTASLPVVYDPRVASSLLGHLVSAINGAGIARGTSFLRDRMDQAIFPTGIMIFDDPLRPRGLRSKPFDGEGQPTSRRAIVEAGVLKTWLLDSRSARQLGLTSTGHAARGTSSAPSPAPSNVYLAPGTLTPAELMADIKEGLYVTELIGMGVNGLTGDYSRGAAGFMIRDGAIAEPVAEMTVAGVLSDMFMHLTAANDLRFRRGTDAPTVRVDGMTMAGA
jgi:PmbA protein